MFTEVIYEQPLASWTSLLEAFSILESFLKVEEPKRPTDLLPSLWIGEYSGSDGGAQAVVYKLDNPENPNPQPSQQYAIVWFDGNELDFEKANYFDPKELDIESLALREPNHMSIITALKHETDERLSLGDRTWLQVTLESQIQKKRKPKRSASARPS